MCHVPNEAQFATHRRSSIIVIAVIIVIIVLAGGDLSSYILIVSPGAFYEMRDYSFQLPDEKC